MKHETDPRINAKYISIKDYFILFWALAAFNGFHMWILKALEDRGMLETNVQMVINILMAYVLVTTICLTGLIAFIRHVSWSRPMRTFSEAARKIAKGDFTIHIFPLRKDGKKDYVEVMFDDLNTMAKELQNVEIMKNDFITNVSHEIKTPLSVIQGYAAALHNDSLNQDTRHEYIKTIIEASQKLSALVSNILKLNKLENQEIQPPAQHFNLGEQIRLCAVAYYELWEAKQIHFETELEDIPVYYDQSLLEIVWNNLISNAIKFTNSGGSITIKLKSQYGYARVSISDTGCGMNEETKKRVFDKFYQGDSSHAQEGNGLGIAMVKRAVDLLGGTITVESRQGQGSTFDVCLKI